MNNYIHVKNKHKAMKRTFCKNVVFTNLDLDIDLEFICVAMNLDL